MAFEKRMGRASPALRQGQLQEPMSPSSDSQNADNEDDHGDAKGKGVGPPLSDNISVKKKRTRTLTTPHQAAVLHALLAQVRTVVLSYCFSSIGHSIQYSVALSYHSYERRSRSVNRPERPQSAGKLLKNIFYPPEWLMSPDIRFGSRYLCMNKLYFDC